MDLLKGEFGRACRFFEKVRRWRGGSKSGCMFLWLWLLERCQFLIIDFVLLLGVVSTIDAEVFVDRQVEVLERMF